MIVNTKSESRFIEQSDLAQKYIIDIRKTKVLTRDEEMELIIKVKNGDEKSKDELITRNQKFILSVSKKFTPNNSLLLDIVNEANIGFIDAIKKYDLDKYDVRLCSYAIHYIRRQINLFLLNNKSLIKQTNFNKTYGKTKKIKNKFYLENGRYPSDYELIEILNETFGYNLSDTNDIVDMTISSIDSSVTDIHNNNTKDDSINLIDKCGYNLNDAIYNEEEDYNKYIVKKLLATLNKRDGDIIRMSFGIDYDRPLDCHEIAEKLGITPERVRQIRANSLHKIKQYKVA